MTETKHSIVTNCFTDSYMFLVDGSGWNSFCL